MTNASQFVARRIAVAFIARPHVAEEHRLGVVRGILIGIGLAFISLQILGNAYVTKVNGWTTLFGCGKPGDGILLPAACSKIFLGSI